MRTVCVALTALGLLAGCTSRGGGGNTAPPLQLLSVSPTEGASAVAPDATIQAVFSRPIAMPAVGAFSVSGTNGPLSGRVAVMGTTLVFAATSLSDPGTRISVTLAPVPAKDGGAPAPARSWSFTLRSDREWSAPDTLGNVAPDSARVALDASGRVTAVWRSGSGGLVTARKEGATDWTTLPLDSGRGTARDAVLAGDDGGHVFAAWVEKIGSGWSMETASLAGLGITRTALATSLKRLSPPSVAFTGEGAPVVVWAEAGGAVQASVGGGGAAVLSTPGVQAFEPTVVRLSSGAVALWRETDFNAMWVMASRFSGGTWSPPVRLSTNTATSAYDPAVVAVGGGALAAWSQRTTAGSQFPAASLYTSVFGGAGWSAPSVLQSPLVVGTSDASGAGIGGITSPVLSPDGSGGAWLFFRERDGQVMSATNLAVLKAVRFTGSGWSAPVPLDDGSAGDPAGFAAAFDPEGNGLLAFSRGLFNASTVGALQLAAGGSGWGALRPFGSPGAGRPVSAASHGRAVILWREADGTLKADRFE